MFGNYTESRQYDRKIYGWRHQVENFRSKVKEFRAIGTRKDGPHGSFAAAIVLWPTRLRRDDRQQAPANPMRNGHRVRRDE